MAHVPQHNIQNSSNFRFIFHDKHVLISSLSATIQGCRNNRQKIEVHHKLSIRSFTPTFTLYNNVQLQAKQQAQGGEE